MRKAAAAFSLLLFSPAFAEGLPADDPTLRPYQITVAQYVNRCSKGLSNVEQANCLNDQYQALSRDINAAYRKAIIDAENIGDNTSVGGKSATEIAKINRAEIVKSQAAWKAYLAARCGTIAQSAERNGANGAGPAVEMTQCYVRFAVARLNELSR